MNREPAHEFEEIGFQFGKRPLQKFPLELFKQARVQNHVARLIHVRSVRKQVLQRVRAKGVNQSLERTWVSTQAMNDRPSLVLGNFFSQAF